MCPSRSSEGAIMRHRLPFVLALSALVLSGTTWTRGHQSSQTSTSASMMDELLQAVRGDLQTSRADIIKKNVALGSSQAAAFWPLFDTYQKEQNAIMDEQLKAIQHYIETSDAVDDAGALAFVNGHLDRDAKMVAL